MSYQVKEIFHTLQGEGAQSGTRRRLLPLCRLQSLVGPRRRPRNGALPVLRHGFRRHRRRRRRKIRIARGSGAADCRETWPASASRDQRFVVCTGGEPLLQLDAALIDALHARGFEIAVETNGTLAAPPGLDWICVSPKAGRQARGQTHGDELKLVYPQPGLDPASLEKLRFSHFFLQPMDGPMRSEYTAAAVAYCQAHPRWRLSLQTHKWIGLP